MRPLLNCQLSMYHLLLININGPIWFRRPCAIPSLARQHVSVDRQGHFGPTLNLTIGPRFLRPTYDPSTLGPTQNLCRLLPTTPDFPITSTLTARSFPTGSYKLNSSYAPLSSPILPINSLIFLGPNKLSWRLTSRFDLMNYLILPNLNGLIL